MRLLQLHDDDKLTLTADLISDIPPYAILSHTWGRDGDEVTFQNLTEKRGIHNKPGYQKILFCGQQAKRDGLKHFWVDTCCIDKTSSAELSEAINSMFKWYKDAKKCYVYLADVTKDDGGVDEPGRSTWKSAFRASKWFTRGWTLQELLAPDSVQFFSVQGALIGDRMSLEDEIYSVTMINIPALRGRSLTKIPAQERMSWSLRRQTTKEEDIAYCLLGIFDVHIPLIYGEGKRDAMQRLIEAIEKRTGIPYCPTLHEATPEPHFIVPFGQNEDFVGRDDILLALVRKILPNERIDACQRTVIQGLRGAGKTQIAVEAAYRVYNQDSTCSVFWVSASTLVTFENAYRAIGEALETPGIHDEKVDVKVLVKVALEKSATNWLLVIDNLDDLGLLATGGLHDFLPYNRKGSILFTTRNHEVAKSLGISAKNTCIVNELNEPETGRSMICWTNTNFIVEAQNMEGIMYSLMSLMPDLAEVLSRLVDGGEMNLTEADAAWIKDKFDELKRFSISACASRYTVQDGPPPTCTSTDENMATGLKRKREAEDEARYTAESSHKRRHKGSGNSSLYGSRPDKHNSRCYETQAGSLAIQTKLEQKRTALTISFTFTPCGNLIQEYRIGFATVFRSCLGKRSIERRLTTFRIVEQNGSAFEAVENGDLTTLKTLFTNRIAFPTDRLMNDGNTLIGYASREVQLPICEFLLQAVEGVDPCETDSEGMNALRQLFQGFQDEGMLVTELTTPDARQRLVSELVEKGCLDYESWSQREAEDGCLHLSGFYEQLAYPLEELSTMVTTLIQRGAGIEIRDRFGKTPLLDNLSITGDLGLMVIDSLLQAKADISAVDANGNGVFHLTLQECWAGQDRLEERLQLLMKYGYLFDLSRANNQGYTPSDFALTPQLWPIWCKMIRKNIPLDELLVQDKHSKIDYQKQMGRSNKNLNHKVVKEVGLARPGVCRPEVVTSIPINLEWETYSAQTNYQCSCNVAFIQFISWETQSTPGQQLPGLLRCYACGGYILPDDMESRKRKALSI